MILNIKPGFKKYIVEIICLLYILLFVYAAVSKLLDFENFQVQLGQSPLLSAFAEWLAVLVPLVEILLVFLLSFQKSREIGLLLSYALMVSFTAYIYIIINYSSFVPCSCGGILEKMGWKQHLFFNFSFVFLGFLGLLMLAKKNAYYIIILRLLFLTAIIAIVMYGAFRISEQIISYHNSFIRRFPPHLVEPKDTIELEFPTFYFAGAGNGKIYLGNQRAVLQVSELDTIRFQINNYALHLKKRDTLYKSLQLRVQPPYFFIADGTTPLLFRGLTTDWQAYPIPIKGRKFNQISIIDFQTLAVRSRKPGSGENAISIFSLDSTGIDNDSLLKKQIDGLFDTDGKLHHDHLTGRLLYCYKYRNGYITFGRDLTSAVQRTTIDTTSKAQISVVHVKSRGELKFDKPPLTVNRTSFFYGGLLFVNSGLPGRFERLEVWNDASIIDVYNVESGAYLLSFYIYNMRKKGVRQIFVHGNSFYSLNGSSLLQYKLSKEITKYFHKIKK